MAITDQLRYKKNSCSETKDIVIQARQVIAVFSLVGCLFVIFVIWLFKKYIVFAQRLILYLCIGACMDSIAYIMGDMRPDSPLCNFEGWFLQYFDGTVLLWVLVITINLYFNVVKERVTEKFEWVYHAVCWIVPLLISFLPFIGDHYGPAGAWCWIIENWRWRLGVWYGPLFIIIIFLFVVYTYIFIVLKRKASTWEGMYNPDIERNQRLLKEDIKPLKFYPFVYLLVSIFPLINRIQNAISPHNHVFALVLLASIFAPLHGALIAVVFGMDIETIKRLTPRQIMVAVMAHRAPKTQLQAYPVEVNITDQNIDESQTTEESAAIPIPK
ncbi:hypothetical protein LOTGIDRAFT_158835 [Lottia gigantea]|uniref:G-protein coupled receptors family 2 profile 2 domain-containing protein n=1 Tax=Lottia gigantea TaxID=225164 RepID=V4ANX8_LOTGI|nr:hypothetical protein LOTGIDRAFT_158835 [Lottia gigantea]ESO98882.1 hypothetical protein LOTGIDRAFT_158835 [Lottia gigantea]